jgi:hypothetical protein
MGMGNWISVKGKVQRGYGVASGKSGDPRFPKGTLELQKPFFYERGLNLDDYYSGTINLSTELAAKLYNQYRETSLVGGLFHSTC